MFNQTILNCMEKKANVNTNEHVKCCFIIIKLKKNNNNG